jgi:multiple sugar transport system ATP-binding protein
VYVTHDQVEAMTLGQRVAVLRGGVLQQVDTPQDLFHRPANLFVAAFIGSPSMNLVEARLEGGAVHFAGYSVPLAEGSAPAGVRRDVILGIRPTDFEHAASAETHLPRITVTPDVVEELGSETHVVFTVDAPKVDLEAVRAASDLARGDEGRLFADDRALCTAVLDARRAVATGEPLELSVDHARLHFFDPDTGAALQARARDAVALP